jgi:dipeptidyl aminopeptidase/acylaminoacyl peptidase
MSVFPISSRFRSSLSCNAALSALLIAAASISAFAQDAPEKARVEEVLKGLNRAHRFGAVAISPDGSALTYVRSGHDGSELVLAPFSDPMKTVRITARKKDDQPCGESDPAWSSDSKHLAFLSDCQSEGKDEGQDQLFLATVSGDVAGGKPKIEIARLTEAKGEVGYPAFSPDGSQIAFLYVEGATRAAGALAAMKPWAGVIGEDGIEIQRVATVPAEARKPVAPAFATPANLHVYEFDWSPDSKSLAYVAANPPGENNWWVAKLYTQTLSSEPKAIFAPSETNGPLHGLQIAVPRWSPDGKSIAFIGGLMSDQGSTGGDVWVIPSTGGDPVDWTAGTTASPAWIAWKNDHILFLSQLSGGNSELVQYDFAENNSERIERKLFSVPGTVGDGRMSMSLSVSKDHANFVFNANSLEHPPEIYAAKTGGPEATSLSQLLWGKSESLAWKSDRFDVQGWLLYPAHYDPARKYGLIVLVHGGPAAAAGSRWGGGGGLSATAFSALDYFVLEPNPRGSYGQGEAFTAANRKDFGYGDLRDILAGVDTALSKYPAIDANRVGLTGWSYGGFMTMFGVTQTNRFKAAVAGAGISDWKSYYGENSIDQWMLPYFGASVYDDPAVYAKSSAIDFIGKVKTPTLAVVGDRDGECPAPQSFEFWHALRDQHIPTQLVVYPNEGHGFVNPEHRTDVLVRTLDWFAKYMPAGD